MQVHICVILSTSFSFETGHVLLLIYDSVRPYLHHTPSCHLKDQAKGTFEKAMTSSASIAMASHLRHLYLWIT